jgi:hypothetical protein
MKAKKDKQVRKRKTAKDLQKSAESHIANLEKTGELNPEHRLDFDQILDDIAPPVAKKK